MLYANRDYPHLCSWEMEMETEVELVDQVCLVHRDRLVRLVQAEV